MTWRENFTKEELLSLLLFVTYVWLAFPVDYVWEVFPVDIVAIIPLIGYIIVALKYIDNILKPVVIFKSIAVMVVLASSFLYPLSGRTYLIIFSIVEILSTLLKRILTKRSFYDMLPTPTKRSDITGVTIVYPILLGIWIFAMLIAMIMEAHLYEDFNFTLLFLMIPTAFTMNFLLGNNISGNIVRTARRKTPKNHILLWILLYVSYWGAPIIMLTIVFLICYIFVAFKFVDNILKPVVIFKSIAVILVLASSFLYPLNRMSGAYLIIFSIVEILSTLLKRIITKRSFYDMLPSPAKRSDIMFVTIGYPLVLGIWIFGMFMDPPFFGDDFHFTLAYLMVPTLILTNVILSNNISGNIVYEH